MGKRDPRVDAYVARAARFAQPILRELREIVHEGCPEVEESIKWGMPSFGYKGILCGMAAFKEHCSFGFWRASHVIGSAARGDAMGSFGRITSMKDLPPRRTLVGYVRKAKALKDEGAPVTPKRRKPAKKAPVALPADLKAALARNPRAKAAFDAFSPSHRREYAEWIAAAKRAETRARRLATAIEWIAQGKGRNWRYER